jgi:hypothetical protein
VSRGQVNLLDSLSGGGLFQINSVFNANNRLLDLLFFNESDDITVLRSLNPLLPSDTHHPPVELYYDYASTQSVKLAVSNGSSPEYDFRNANFAHLCGYLQGVDWSGLMSDDLTVDGITNMFYDKLLTGIHLFVPRKSILPKSHPMWYNRAILRLKNLKSKKYKLWIASKNNCDYVVYSYALRELNRLKSSTFNSYLRKTQLELKTNPKRFWAYVNSQRNSSCVPTSVSFGARSSSDPIGIVNVFADFFKSVYADVDVEVSSDTLSDVREHIPIGSITLSRDQVLKALRDLDVSKSKGPDVLSPFFLKMCADELSYPICCIFNRSLSAGVFPDRWKLSHVTPVFKSGSRVIAGNYRGIAILPTIAKLFECIICSILTEHFNGYISSRQHGFMKGRSTETNLVEFAQTGLDVIESGNQLDVVYTDFSKAFDRVSHSILIAKLERMGLHSSLLAWIRSYLVGRRQFVLMGGSRSRVFSVATGVPQGSHMGPLLFLLFVNDIIGRVKYSKCLMYADDLKVFLPISSVRDCSYLQRDLDSLFSWCQVNRLALNLSKCKTMSFRRRINPILFEYEIDGVTLDRVNRMSDLGILFDEKMIFSSHIECIVTKAFSRIGFMKRICRQFDDPYCLKSIYCALIRSVLEYGSTVWSPGYAVHADRIESIQKKFLLYALRHLGWRGNTFVLPPYEDRCRLIALQTLSNRRTLSALMFTFDILTNRKNAPDLLSMFDFNIPPRSLRVSNFFRVSQHRTNYGLFSPISNLSYTFNRFSSCFDFHVSRVSFRRAVELSL